MVGFEFRELRVVYAWIGARSNTGNFDSNPQVGLPTFQNTDYTKNYFVLDDMLNDIVVVQ